MTTVDQARWRRAGTGLRAHDPELAYQGYTLFAPNTGPGDVFLINMEGNVVHQWRMPYPPGLSGYLTPEGTLIYNGKVPEESERYISGQPWKGGAILEADRDSNILWEVQHPDHHHDGIKLRSGNVMLLCLARLEPEVAAQVRGGRPGSEAEDGAIYADYIVELDQTGWEVWRWNSWDHLDPTEDGIAAPMDKREEWTHGNSIFEMADGNLLVSFRHPSMVTIIERRSGEVIWKFGAPPLAQQHAPVELENGNILIFDNGTHRLDHEIPHSRVIEVDPETKEIVWSYQERYVSDFFSPLISNATRLPNGNTLICEGSFGRFFEVTAEGDVVWEYINPHFYEGETPHGPTISNRVFRCYRYAKDQIPWLG
ncbi:MAG: aryl-sulfate sulfotransferase [Chloroflexota bacterium]